MAKKLLKPSDIPSQFVILGYPIVVKLEKIRVDSHEEFVYGEYDPQSMTIKIDPRHPNDPRLLQDTLCHELGHAVFHLSGVSGLTDTMPNLEECLVRAITPGFAKAIDLNKLLPQVSVLVPEDSK